jgi:signal transduction histidine kinase/CheY-like chemotaxis protein
MSDTTSTGPGSAGHIEGERASRLRLLSDVARRTTALLPLEDLLRSAVHIVKDTFDYFMVNIFLVEGDSLIVSACTMPDLQHLVGTLHLAIGAQGITGWVAANGRPLNVPDVRKDPRYHFTDERELRTCAEVAVPITLKGVVIGVLDAQSDRLGAYSDLDVFTLQAVADQLAVAMENARLYDQLQRELARRTELLGRLEKSIAELSQTQAQLLHAQKMEAVGRLAGGVAHDFNNQLTAINGYAELLADALALDDPLRTHASEIISAGRRAAGLTRQLLAFSRKQVLQPRAVDLAEMVNGLRGMLSRIIGENIRLVTSIRGGPAVVHADPAQLEHAVVNLVVNARDAMPDGGMLTIAVEGPGTAAASAPVPAAPAPGSCLLSVVDTGIGMTPEVRAQLFEPFFTTKPPGKGTGLGLSTVYGIVTQSGGTIECASEPGQGARFTIRLPAATLSVRPAPAAAAAATAHRGSGTILVVEDEDYVRQLVVKVLQDAGYAVRSASTAAAALELVRAVPAPTLVITDIMLPGGMSGFDLARRLREGGCTAAIVAMSGYYDQLADTGDAFIPAEAFLAKPFSPSDLLKKVRDTMERAS